MSNGNASMNGFVTVGVREGNDGKNEMSMWPPEKIPVMTTLANEFALFDNYFCSYPGNIKLITQFYIHKNIVNKIINKI
jgi:phospholipase C